MQKRFWINRIQVDLTRNQITRDGEEFSLQPKILAVLRILALHQGKVVSHDQLMDEVWGEATVSPNTLQRCIAQLRKALGDDSRSQQVIKTHSKQGYSLETHVSWDEQAKQSPPEQHSPISAFTTATKSDENQASKSFQWRLPIAIVGLGLLIAFALSVFTLDKVSNNYSSIRQLTSSDEKEYNPNYSPDGRYMVFHRYLDVCENHLWAKDLKTNQEIRLTKTPAIYGPHSWSVDGNQLAFIKQENCQKAGSPQQACWRLQTLDFAAALQNPIDPQQRLDCEQSYSQYPVWMNNGSILLLKQHQGQMRLMVYDARSTELREFYLPEQGQLYDYDYSSKLDRLVVMTRLSHNDHYMEFVDTQGKLINRQKINPLPTHSVFQNYYAGFHPSGEYLISDLDNGLHRLSFDGDLTPIKTPDNMFIATPRFHPLENKIVATSGKVDLDIARIDLANLDALDPKSNSQQPHANFNHTSLSYPSIARTTRAEKMARINPVSNSVAFISERTGLPQVWLYSEQSDEQALNKRNEGQSIQLSDFENYQRIGGLEWSPDGTQLGLVINDNIHLIGLDGAIQSVALELEVRELLQWIDDEQMLVLLDQTEVSQLAKVNIKTGEISVTSYSRIRWAKTYQEGFILQDQYRQLWRTQNNAEKVKLPFDQNILNGKQIILSESSLYGISITDQLWQFNLDNNQFEFVSPVEEDLWWVMDKKEDILLAAQGVSARKEIVELTSAQD